MTARLSTKYLPLDEIVPNAENPKLHNIKAIVESYGEIGYAEPIIVDGRTGTLLAGHGRVEALATMRAAGAEPPEHIDVVRGRWLVPVTIGVSSVDDDQARRFIVGANRITEAGGWDEKALGAILSDLAKTPAGLAGTGFDDRELVQFLASLSKDDPPIEDPDAIPTVTSPVTRPGDVWLLGDHRIMCGDATIAADVAKLLGETAVDGILTDPPYCSGGFQESGRAQGSVGTAAVHKQVANDRLSTRGYVSLLKGAIGAAPAPYIYVFTNWRMWTHLFDVVESCGFGVRSMIVWDKGTPGMGRGWRSQHELVMWGAKATPPFDKHAPGGGNIIRSQRTGNPLHTTQKPVDLLAALLEQTPFIRSIYDPFAGAASTLIAAIQAGRTWRGMEIDPGYVDVSCRRWQLITEGVPVLERTGEAISF